MSHRSLSLLAATTAIAVAAAACTSSSPKPATATTAPPSSATTAPSQAASTTIAPTSADPHAYLLELSDLPQGLWKAQAHSPDPNRRTNDAFYDTCLGVPTIDDNESAVYYSDFARSDNQSFSSSEVDVVGSAAYASRDFAALKGPKGIPCVLSSAKHDFAEQNKTATNKLTADQVSAIDAPAPFFGYRLTTTLSPPSGSSEPVVIDTYYVQHGADEIQIQFLSVNSADSTTAASALAAVAKRIQG